MPEFTEAEMALGELAYDAWCERARVQPIWEQLPNETCKAWAAAAREVQPKPAAEPTFDLTSWDMVAGAAAYRAFWGSTMAAFVLPWSDLLAAQREHWAKAARAAIQCEEHTTFDSYQERSFAFARYPGRGTGNHRAISFLALGLGEAGELQGKIKKYSRGDDGWLDDDEDKDEPLLTGERKQALIEEAGDLLWYLAMLTKELGITLGEVADINLAKLESRRARNKIAGDGDTR